MRIPAVLACLSLAAAAEPLRYSSEVGDSFNMYGEFRSETIVRRGTSVEKSTWARPGRQRVMALAREGAATLFAIEIDHEAGRPLIYVVDGQDRLRSDLERLKAELPGPQREVAFLTLDERGLGAPLPLDPELPDALIRILDEIEVLPADEAASWTRKGELGPVSWEGVFERKETAVSAVFDFRLREDRGAKLLFDRGRASLEVRDGRPSRITGSAAWTLAGEQGSERREISFNLWRKGGGRLAAEDAADAASDAGLPAAAEEAWRSGERDRALEIWDKVGADAANRWADRAKERAAAVRRDWPMLGAAVGAWGARTWIGPAPGEGKWVLAYFWATWARRCEGELGGLAKILRGRDRVAGAAVTMADALQSEDQVRSFLAARELPFGVGIDDGTAFRAFKVEDVPRVFLLDPDGKVRFAGRGNETETLRGLLDRLVPE